MNSQFVHMAGLCGRAELCCAYLQCTRYTRPLLLLCILTHIMQHKQAPHNNKSRQYYRIQQQAWAACRQKISYQGLLSGRLHLLIKQPSLGGVQLALKLLSILLEQVHLALHNTTTLVRYAHCSRVTSHEVCEPSSLQLDHCISSNAVAETI